MLHSEKKKPKRILSLSSIANDIGLLKDMLLEQFMKIMKPK